MPKQQPSHIDIFLVQPHYLTAKVLNDFQQLISPQEQETIDRRRTDDAKRDALVTRGLVRTVLSRYSDISPSQWQFDKGWNGKPFIANSNESKSAESLEFNLSHAHHLIALAVTRGSVIGIDVEYTKRKSATKKLAPRYFSASEVEALQMLPSQEQQVGFYDYWTLKESYIKACGDGLSVPLHLFSFDIQDRDNISLTFDEKRKDNSERWHNKLFTVNEQHKMAITIETPPSKQVNVAIHQLTPNGEFEPCELPLKV